MEKEFRSLNGAELRAILESHPTSLSWEVGWENIEPQYIGLFVKGECVAISRHCDFGAYGKCLHHDRIESFVSGKGYGALLIAYVCKLSMEAGNKEEVLTFESDLGCDNPEGLKQYYLNIIGAQLYSHPNKFEILNSRAIQLVKEASL